MPVTFGAVGDIISVVLLVKDLVATLDEARGSKAEYQAAIHELWLLDRTLLEIELLTRQHGDGATPELRGLCETAKRAVARCHDQVTTFSQRIRKYQSTFDHGQNPNALREIGHAILWRIGEKEALERFRAELAGTTSSLQMLMVTANITLLQVNRKEMKHDLDDVKRRNDNATLSHDASLDTIKDGLENANRKIEAGNSILGNLSEAIKLEWLRNLGCELIGLVRSAMMVNFATYRAVIRIQNALPSHLERGLIEEPMILEDSIGRIAPVHLQFITSWDAFHSVLEVRFRNMPGHRKLKQRRYALQAGGTGRDVELSRPWQNAFLPGQRIEMSFIFEDRSGGNTCPGCQNPSEHPAEVDTRCSTCGLSFRRVEEVQDIGRPEEVTAPPNDFESFNREPTSLHGFIDHEDTSEKTSSDCDHGTVGPVLECP
ncbi:unnamed protein product [Alternaria alternata]